MRVSYEGQVSKSIEETNYRSDDVNSVWEAVKTSVVAAAQLSLGIVTNKPRYEWFDEKCRLAVEAQNIALNKMQTRFTASRKNKAVLARRAAKRICRRKKRVYRRSRSSADRRCICGGTILSGILPGNE